MAGISPLITVTVMVTLMGVRGGNIQGSVTNRTLTLGYSMPWRQGWTVGQRIGSAIIVGIREVKRRQLLPGYEIEWIWRDSYCEPRRGMAMAVDIWASVEDLDGIIGDGCSVVCQPVSMLAASWGIPVVAWACTSGSLSDKTTYPTFTRVQGTWITLGPVFNALADMFNWNRVCILTTPEDIMKLTAEAFKSSMEDAGKHVTLRVVYTTVRGDVVDEDSMQALRDTMAQMKNEFRIFYIISYPTDVRNMLITALDEGMLNGQYVFATFEFAIDLGAVYNYRPDIDDIIYPGVLVVGVKKTYGPKYDQFLIDVLEAFQDPVFANLPHLGPNADVNVIDQYAGKVS